GYWSVTGVQTCALPICCPGDARPGGDRRVRVADLVRPRSRGRRAAGPRAAGGGVVAARRAAHLAGGPPARAGGPSRRGRRFATEIGRASCRERVGMSGG